jgi:AcrR family transcriptional regulator
VTRRLTDRGRERRQQIIELATRRFADGGYDRTSVAEIVTTLGVGKGVFYWYFDSKEELFQEILREAMKDLRRSQQLLIADVDDPVERLRLGIRASARWWADHRDLYRLLEFAATQQDFARSIRKGREVAVGDTMKHVRDAIDRGLIRDVDPLYIAHAILAVTSQLVGVFVHQKGNEPDRVAEMAASFVLEGILRPPDERRDAAAAGDGRALNPAS